MTDRATSARIAVLITDLVLVTGSFAGAMAWNLGRGSQVFDWLPLLFVPPMQLVAYQVAGAYDAALPGRAWQWVQGALNGHFLLCLLIAVGLYLGNLADEVPRLAFVSWAVLSLLAVAASRVVLRAAWLARAPLHAYARKTVLIGSMARCMSVLTHLRAGGQSDLVPVGIATDDTLRENPPDGIHLVRIEDAPSLALELGAERVLLCASLADDEFIDQQLRTFEPFPLEIQLVPDQDQFPFFCLGSEEHDGLPVLNLSVSPMTVGDRLAKRVEDLVLGTMILALIWPIMLVVAIAVKCSGRGPVLYAQRRHGLMGGTITVYKFRTMTWSPDMPMGPDDASGTHDAAKAFLSPRTGMFRQAKSGDARVTRLGHFLRSSSLDELPQFFNVIKGDMSIVGPRPHARKHNLEFIDRVPGLMRRHYVKPGITGLAQISGARGRTRTVDDMQRRVSLDLRYIREWSLWLDLRIIAMTIIVGFINHEP